MRTTVLWSMALVGCVARGPASPPSSSAGERTTSQGSAGSTVTDSSGSARVSEGPPTQEECEAQPSDGTCHHTLMPTYYCGGPVPSPEMLWPRCSCEPCTRDEHCGRGRRCVGLTTDDECAPLQNVCVDPDKSCTADADCPSGKSCLLEKGRPRCRVRTIYPPRP